MIKVLILFFIMLLISCTERDIKEIDAKHALEEQRNYISKCYSYIGVVCVVPDSLKQTHSDEMSTAYKNVDSLIAVMASHGPSAMLENEDMIDELNDLRRSMIAARETAINNKYCVHVHDFRYRCNESHPSTQLNDINIDPNQVAFFNRVKAQLIPFEEQ